MLRVKYRQINYDRVSNKKRLGVIGPLVINVPLNTDFSVIELNTGYFITASIEYTFMTHLSTNRVHDRLSNKK